MGEVAIRAEPTSGLRPASESFLLPVPGCLCPVPTMAGLLKRKFDQLEEDDSSLCSSSSLSSSGHHSGSCSPSSSVSPAWDLEEESPWDQMSPPDRNVCGPQSFTRESLPSREPHHTLPPFFLPS